MLRVNHFKPQKPVSFPIEFIKGSVHDCGLWKTFAY